MKPITIIGGGIAGLALGVFLRRENIPVTIFEAGHYPRHRVCGEFLSGRGKQILEAFAGGSGLEGDRCAFFLNGRAPIHLRLRESARCISRFELDAFLADEFQNYGGVLKTNERNAGGSQEGIVFATGRRRAENSHGHLLGLKAHAEGATLQCDLQMHFGKNHYVGISRLAGDRVNVCGLFFASAPVQNIRDSWQTLFANAVSSSALKSVRWVADSFCSVAGLTMDREAPSDKFSIGDAAAMIPPLTGNGMSMALESAELAYPLVTQYAGGKLDWKEALVSHAASWKTRFASRLRWAGFLQKLAFNAAAQRAFFLGARACPALPQAFFDRTR
jgi:flavin-dependent dehydrogenase